MHKNHGLNPDIKSTLCVHNYACACVVRVYTCTHLVQVQRVKTYSNVVVVSAKLNLLLKWLLF